MAIRFEGKVALVSSAASGIGAATALAFAREGARLVISDLNEAGLKATAERIKEIGSNVEFVVADGTEESQVELTVRKAAETYGRLDIAANVVGGSTGDALSPTMHEQSVSGWAGTMALCATSAFISLKHEIAYMREHGGGAIVNVSSLAGMRFVREAGAAYAAGKAAVIQLTKYAAMNYAADGIRVNCVSPGATATPAVAGAFLTRMLEYHAIKRPVAASEQAAAILWLCSEEAAMVTGLNLPVDGGWAEK